VPSLCDNVVILHASVAVAVPNAAVISDANGLHPKLRVVPLVLITGGVRSEVQETVFDTVDVLPHASVAVNILVCVNVQLEVAIVPSLCVIVGLPQASEAVALPSAVLIALDVGLHPNVVLV
jgi:hypothetical protein